MAQGIYNVPPLMTAEDFQNDSANIDELSVMMYVTVLATQLNKRRQQRFNRQSLVMMGGKEPTVTKEPMAMRIYFEGMPDFEFKMLKIAPGT
jgi:hypothetical protein